MHYLHEGDGSDASNLTQTRDKLYKLLKNTQPQIM